MKDSIENGLKVYQEIRGEERAEKMRSEIVNGKFGSIMTGLSMEFVFGGVWGRDGLDKKHRSLITIGVLIALRATDELKNHIRIAITNGLTVGELDEAILQAAVYAGFPAARAASLAAIEVLKDLNLY